MIELAEKTQNVRCGQIDFAAVPLTAAAGSGPGEPGTTCALQFPQLSIFFTASDGVPSVSRVSIPVLNSPATKMSGLTVET